MKTYDEYDAYDLHDDSAARYEAERARCERCAAVRDIYSAYWHEQGRLIDTNYDRAYYENNAADDEAFARAWRAEAHAWQVCRDAALAIAADNKEVEA